MRDTFVAETSVDFARELGISVNFLRPRSVAYPFPLLRRDMLVFFAPDKLDRRMQLRSAIQYCRSDSASVNDTAARNGSTLLARIETQPRMKCRTDLHVRLQPVEG